MAEEYNVSGEWTLSQDNGWHVDLDIDQTGTTIKGEAFGHHPSVSTTMSGSGEGSVSQGPGGAGQQFSFIVLWGGANPIRAAYNGTFGLDNRITGRNFAVNNPSVQTGWVSDKTFKKFPPPLLREQHERLSPYSPECVEWAFCELRPYAVLRSSA